jgi:hypothetical protein
MATGTIRPWRSDVIRIGAGAALRRRCSTPGAPLLKWKCLFRRQIAESRSGPDPYPYRPYPAIRERR